MEKLKQNRVLIRRIIVISSIVVAVLAIFIGSYIATYNRTNITCENAYEVSDKIYVCQEDFLKNFSSFDLTVADGNYIEPYKKDDGTIVNGKLTINFEFYYNSINDIKKDSSLKIKGFLGADWLNYRSTTSSERTMSTGKSTNNYIQLTGLSQIFPAKTNMWFVTVEDPSVFIMISYSNAIGQDCYTVLEYKLSELL